MTYKVATPIIQESATSLADQGGQQAELPVDRQLDALGCEQPPS